MDVPHQGRSTLLKLRRARYIAGKESRHLQWIGDAVNPHIDQRRSRLHHLRGHKTRPADRRHQDVGVARVAADVWVLLWHTVTVAEAFSSIIAAGFPTISDRPSTTACCPATDPAALQDLHDPRRSTGSKRRPSLYAMGRGTLQSPHINRMKPIHIFLRRHRLQQPSRIHMRGQRKLDQNPIHFIARIQSGDRSSSSSVVTLSGGVSISLHSPNSAQVFTLLRT